MEMILNEAQGSTMPVTIIRLDGNLDGSNYQDVIDKGKALYDTGVRRLLLDMSRVKFMSSAGLVALHSLVLVYRGEDLPDLSSGWGALSAIDQDAAGKQSYLKLLNPPERIVRTLEMSGMDAFLDVFNDEADALASF